MHNAESRLVRSATYVLILLCAALQTWNHRENAAVGACSVLLALAGKVVGSSLARHRWGWATTEPPC